MRQVPLQVVAWVRRRGKALLLTAGAVVLIGGLVMALWVFDPVNYPVIQATHFRATATALNDQGRMALERDLLQYQTDNQIKTWTTIVQAVGAFVLAVGGSFAYWNLQVAQRNLRATHERLDFDRDATERRLMVDRDSQVTNRFTQAITQFGAELQNGKPHLEVRLGGIYALERIAKDSPRDHWPIMEVLTAYVRENAYWTPYILPQAAATQAPTGAPDGPGTSGSPLPKPRADIQAVLSVLRRRISPKDIPAPDQLDLSATDLRGADLAGAPLDGALIENAQMDGASFRGAHLEGASFTNAHLQGVDFRDTRLTGAGLGNAHLEGALFSDAYLQGASLLGAYVQGASFLGAHLEEASFGNAHLQQGDFDGAYLGQADFADAYDLTPQQVLCAADQGRGAVLPAVPQRWTTEQQETVERAWQQDSEPAAEQVPPSDPDATATPNQQSASPPPAPAAEADGAVATPPERTPPETPPPASL